MPTSSDPDRRGLYLVERYLAAAAADGLPDTIARLAEACGRSGRRVRYLHSTYLPSEDTCFCLFEAGSPEAVRAVNAAAGFTVDRITTAVVMYDAAALSETLRSARPGDPR
jgi:hypothetical protein